MAATRTATATITAVVTADLVDSRRYGKKARTELDRVIRQSFAGRQLPGALRPFRTAAAGFHITVGDEFQFASQGLGLILPFLTHLRARVVRLPVEPKPQFRVGIGIGTVTLARSDNAYEQDGPAFVMSREALNALKDATRGRGQLTAMATGDAERDRELNTLLALMDYVQRRWTRPQFEAVDLALQGATLQQASVKLGVRHQNVHKRLRAAGWFEFNQAQELLAERLVTLERVK